MDDILAIINLDQNKVKTKIVIIQKEFKFGCTRCSDLCCKLGGPELTERDVKKIMARGVKDFLDPKKCISNNLQNTVGSLKTKKDGSCIFLQYDRKNSYSTCSIYDVRPTLCRLYPFRIEKLDSNKIAFKFIPCCKGFNKKEGKILDKKFFLENLKEALKVFNITN